MIFQNYHRHSFYSNIITSDSPTSNRTFAQRAKELGHGIICSMEHGWQGYYYETYELAKEFGLKFIFATEAYWVKNRFEQDNTNAHIVLCAKNEKGRRAINLALSEANETGYYYKPRLDLELILNLPPDDVFITTACVGFWQYGQDIVDIVLQLKNHFKDNFMLEVQYHNTDVQKELNKKILILSKVYNIPLIMGCDSHYIYPEDTKERDNILLAKGIKYADEDGWFMDYPSGEEAFQRFVNQGVLSQEEIKMAMSNSNIFLTFDEIIFDKSIKLPTLYPELNQNEKNIKFKELIWSLWNEQKYEVPYKKHSHYVSEIQKELDVIINTSMADYFFIDYYMVKDAVEHGGIITKSGRGSAVSFFINKLLGLTNVDRISAKVHMYPERFMSESRILESGSLPDIDLNLGNPQTFAQAQERLLGEGHSYPMIAFGTFKDKSAFKLYARAKSLDFDISNEITSQLDKYEKALKYAEDDEKDTILMSDYIEEQYLPYIEESKQYYGIISDKKAHPCAYLLYQGNIKEEIGLIRCQSESTGKSVLTTVIDGLVAEKYKFLKNDLLKVDVVLINQKVYDRIGIEPLSVNKLLEETQNNPKTWDIYNRGLTLCINQVEGDKTKQKSTRYKPTNISELTAFIAGIRPSFQSMYSTFESRQEFSYGITAFDKILQTEELPYSFVLYQEQIMATLAYAGFPSDETYTIMKAISKKREGIINGIKERFIAGFAEKVKQEQPYLDSDIIHNHCLKVWQIIEDSVAYGFNASHAYCVSCDSLDGAYLKANYPFEFYEVTLNHYTEKGNKEKVSSLIKEMEYGFGIKLGEFKFRNDNRGFVADKEINVIQPSLVSIKHLNLSLANDLFQIKDMQFDTFVDLLRFISDNSIATSRQIEILIKINYFSEFGKRGKLLSIYSEFKNSKNRYNKKHVDKTKDKRLPLLVEFENSIRNEEMNISEAYKAEVEYTGYIQTLLPNCPPNRVLVINVDIPYTHPFVTICRLCDGQMAQIKIKSPVFEAQPFEKFDLLELLQVKEEKKWRPLKDKDGKTKFVQIDETELILQKYNVAKNNR